MDYFLSIYQSKCKVGKISEVGLSQMILRQKLTRTHHMKDCRVWTGGENHLRLEARLEEGAVSRHRAATTAGGGESGNQC